MMIALIILIVIAYPLYRYKKEYNRKRRWRMIIDEAEEFIRKADENVRLMKQRRCKNHVWRKHYLNGGKVCQVCGKAKEIPTRNKDVEE